MRGILQAAAPGFAEDLDRLCEEMRGIQYHWGLRFEHADGDLGLDPETIRIIALHLLRQGVTILEIMTGLELLTTVVSDEDIELIREIALLQGDYGYAATKMLRTCSNPGHSLHWLAVRSSIPDQTTYTDALAALSAEDIEPLLAELNAADRVELIRMMSHRSHTPTWMQGGKQFAVPLALAAKRPELFGPGLSGLTGIVQVRDDLLYGHSAFLEIEQGLRASIARDLLAALQAPERRALVSAALALDPHDSEAIWLHQYIERADDGDGDFPPGLAIRIAVPAPATGQPPRTHLVVDGVPLVTNLFDLGVPDSPSRLLHRKQGLRARAEVHEVWLAEADCTEGCCGVLAAQIRRDEASGQVLWEVKATRSRSEPTPFTFNADEYDAEVARAEEDRSWEWPALQAARLLNQRLRDEPALLDRWDCRNGGVGSWNSDRSLLQLHLWHPEPPNPDRPWLQFKYPVKVLDSITVDNGAIAARVEEILERLRTTDPKLAGQVCGGSQAHAEALGYPWPPPR
ncbi:hypothetical protein [Glycomyces tritici]|uniref:DUF4132 domain-containing protein n=1 Tax=Glycomyces tritici TaxID=2665176 RepID=A0ABT7YNW3_9ACTN|nr:hypothetical protein [Glycomyces tritici]MDN3240308.1 hypothetical protein [Glycomyces tritici]